MSLFRRCLLILLFAPVLIYYYANRDLVTGFYATVAVSDAQIPVTKRALITHPSYGIRKINDVIRDKVNYVIRDKINNVVYDRQTIETVEEQSLVTFDSTRLDTKLEKVEYFTRYWRMQHEYRVNWSRILAPCKHKTKWEPLYKERRRQMYTSANRTRVKLNIQVAGQYSRLILESRGATGNIKTEGGDTWRVFVYGATSIPVTVQDNMDGTYEAVFLVVEPGDYYIDLHLDYTLCDGFKDPPPLWFTKGNAQGKYQRPNTLPGRERAFLEQKYPYKLEFTVYRDDFSVYGHLKNELEILYPIHPCYMWDGFGRWLNDTKWRMYEAAPYKQKTDIAHRKGEGTFWIFGDSTGDFFYRVNMNRALCKRQFYKCNRTYNWVYDTHADLQKAKLEWDSMDFRVERILKELQQVLVHPDVRDDSALLLNYGLHYTQTVPFATFQKMIDLVIGLLKEQRPEKLKVIWRTTTAFQKWKWGDPKLMGRFSKDNRFFTSQRVQLFNAYSTYRMCAVGVDVLDVFSLTLSYPKGTGSARKPWDAVHYEPLVFRSVEDYLVSYFDV